MDRMNERLGQKEEQESGVGSRESGDAESRILNPESQPSPDRALWDELVHAEAECRVPNPESQASPELCPRYWIGFPGNEHLYYREDVHALAIMKAYRNGRAYEWRHGWRLRLAAALAGVFGLAAGAAAVLVIFEMVM